MRSIDIHYTFTGLSLAGYIFAIPLVLIFLIFLPIAQALLPRCRLVLV